MTRKKAPPKKRNPVVREFIVNPKRNAGKHKPKGPSKRDQERVEEDTNLLTENQYGKN
jgi:hypothetical protein